MPFDFQPVKLKEYVEEHANEARMHAKEFVKSSHTTNRINEALKKAA